MAADSRRVREKEEVNRAGKIDNRRGRTDHPPRTVSQRCKNILNRQLIRSRDTRVMPAKRVQLVGVGRSDQRFAKLRGHFHRPAVQIEKAFVKVTKLDRIETIDLSKKPFANRAAQHVKRMRCEGEDRQSAAGAQFSKVVEIL